MRIASLGLLLVAIILGGWLFLKEVSAIKKEIPTAWKEDHSADCGVVLTGGSGRVREGFDLLAQGHIKKLIISGVHPRAQLREIFPEWPFYGELNENDVILERRSGTTYGNAQQSLVLVEALHCRDVVLVTSTLHMHRAKQTFKAVFPKEISLFYRSIVSGSIQPPAWDLGIEGVKSVFYSIWAY